MTSVNLTNHFLIAMPNMVDPHFARTLTYICEHTDQGALGLVVNRPIDLTLGALFEQLDIALEDTRCASMPVYFGGPVQTDRGFVLHHPVGEWSSTLTVDGTVGLTTSRDVLREVGQGRGPERLIVTLGYAGWDAGQLEHELAMNGWLTVEANLGVMFDLPAEERLPAAMELLGVSYATLSEEAGHA
jgi:putative transcriptional regulator